MLWKEVCVCCVCVCVTERERERDRQTETERLTQREQNMQHKSEHMKKQEVINQSFHKNN